MTFHDNTVVTAQQPDAARGTLMTYVTGFVMSIILTVVAYVLVTNQLYSGWGMTFILIGLAGVQLLVQLIFFLHMGRESKPRWNAMAFVCMLIFLFIIAGGSLWIMDNLNERMMSPQASNTYIQKEEGIYR